MKEVKNQAVASVADAHAYYELAPKQDQETQPQGQHSVTSLTLRISELVSTLRCQIDRLNEIGDHFFGPTLKHGEQVQKAANSGSIEALASEISDLEERVPQLYEAISRFDGRH